MHINYLCVQSHPCTCDVSSLQLSDEAIEQYESTHREQEHKMRAFFQLKALLAPCIEALVLLDRLLYLLEQVSGALWCKPHIPTAHWLMVSRFSQF